MIHDLVFLFDVDNTLLNNDRVQADLDVYLGVTTVFPRQGHYATDSDILAKYPHGEIELNRIADLVEHDFSDYVKQ